MTYLGFRRNQELQVYQDYFWYWRFSPKKVDEFVGNINYRKLVRKSLRAKSKFRSHSQKIIFANILSIDRHRRSSKGRLDLENRQNQLSWSATRKQPKFEAKWGGLKTLLARTQEESAVKYFLINQFIKGSTSGLMMNSYLNDNLEDKKCYFSLGSFSTKRNLYLDWKLHFIF